VAETEATVALDGTAATEPLGQRGSLTPYGGQTYGRVRGQAGPSGIAISRNQALAGAAVLLAVLVLVVVAASGGGGGNANEPTTTLQPAPAGAPADQQINQLERIVRQAPQR
jgi:hypothetical protein